MNRIKDYACFATSFAGLGYIVLWPITASESGGAPIGGSMLCHDGSAGWLGILCDGAHPLRLPAGLHALGSISAVLAVARLLTCLHKRSRRPVPQAPRLPIAQDNPAPRKRSPPLQRIKPRTEFGLRGVRR